MFCFPGRRPQLFSRDYGRSQRQSKCCTASMQFWWLWSWLAMRGCWGGGQVVVVVLLLLLSFAVLLRRSRASSRDVRSIGDLGCRGRFCVFCRRLLSIQAMVVPEQERLLRWGLPQVHVPVLSQRCRGCCLQCLDVPSRRRRRLQHRKQHPAPCALGLQVQAAVS